jgi:hypothetical protein
MAVVYALGLTKDVMETLLTEKGSPYWWWR